ncbi:unnamed protein product, partial [Choristocarpus tenellus]
LVAPPERINGTRMWVVASYALSTCGVWLLSYVVPWWGWLALAAVVWRMGKRVGSLVCSIGRR